MYVSEFVIGVFAVLAIETVIIFASAGYSIWKSHKGDNGDGEDKQD